MLLLKKDLEFSGEKDEQYRIFYVGEDDKKETKVFKTKQEAFDFGCELGNSGKFYVVFDVVLGTAVFDGGMYLMITQNHQQWNTAIKEAIEDYCWSSDHFKDIIVNVAKEVDSANERFMLDALGSHLGYLWMEWAADILRIFDKGADENGQDIVIATMPLYVEITKKQ